MLINITHNAYTCTIICHSTNIWRFYSSPTHLNTSPSVPRLVPIVVRVLHSICNTQHAVLNATASTKFLLSVDWSLFSVFNWWVILLCKLSFFKNRSSTMKTFNPTCDHAYVDQIRTLPISKLSLIRMMIYVFEDSTFMVSKLERPGPGWQTHVEMILSTVFSMLDHNLKNNWPRLSCTWTHLEGWKRRGFWDKTILYNISSSVDTL